MPILGILASSFRSAAGPQGAYDSLATVTLSASASSITFAGIPSGYKHLQIRFIGRVDDANTADNIWIQFNGDTASNYSWHYLEGDGSGVATSGAANFGKLLAGRVSAASATSGIFGAGCIDILDYANTNKYKTVKNLTGVDRNGSGNVRMDSGNWRSTSAITSISITNGSATNFIANTQFALYGIK